MSTQQEAIRAPSDIRILVAEDDPRIAGSVCAILEKRGFGVRSAGSAAEFRRLWKETGPDLVLLDLGLGDNDGLGLAREIKQREPGTGLLIVSGHDDLRQRIAGFDAGADDFIGKPFPVDELIARIRAVLRRRRNPADAAPDSAEVTHGPIVLRVRNHTLHHRDLNRSVQFTDTESRMLEILLRENGRPVSRATLYPRHTIHPADRSVDVHIANIRRKLRLAGMDDLRILPVRGIGYRLAFDGSTVREPGSPPSGHRPD